jgi:hypothetical protein
LTAFVRGLRASLNLLLADGLATADRAPVNLRLLVTKQAAGRTAEPVPTSPRPPEPMTRDLKRVPAPPPLVSLDTGDRVRLEVVADQPGYLTVFNVGPTGNLHLLYPADPDAPATCQPADEVLRIYEVELTPPSGQERVVAVWTRRPLPVGGLVGEPYRATRDMARVARALDAVAPADRHAVVLELDHR